MNIEDSDRDLTQESDISHSERPSKDMQYCLDEIVSVLRKHDVGVTLCLANDKESVLMYRIPEWCAVVLNDGEPEINPERLWQTENLELLLSRTYRLASTICQMNERLYGEASRLEEFVRSLSQHLLDPNRKSH